MSFERYIGYPFPADSFKKYKLKTNLNMWILMYFKFKVISQE